MKVAESEQAVARLEDEIRNGEKMRDYLSKQFDDMITWADIYDGCDHLCSSTELKQSAPVSRRNSHLLQLSLVIL